MAFNCQLMPQSLITVACNSIVSATSTIYKLYTPSSIDYCYKRLWLIPESEGHPTAISPVFEEMAETLHGRFIVPSPICLCD